MREETIITIIVAVFASSGFWAFLQFILQSRSKRAREESAEMKMIRGLGHDRICHLSQKYIHKGYVTKDEYENLYEFLYLPYRDLGGNGTAERLIKEVMKLPIKE